MFEELFRRLPDIRVTGEPDMLQSNFIHGIKRMPNVVDHPAVTTPRPWRQSTAVPVGP